MMEAAYDETIVPLDAIKRLSKDLREASRLIGVQEARYLVDLYYQIQDVRKAQTNRVGACRRADEPAAILEWVATNTRTLEADIASALGEFAAGYAVGRWLQSITGVGQVLSAGLLAGFDIRRAPTAGHYWRYAGYDPTQQWVSAADARKLVAEIMGSAKRPKLEHIEQAAARLNRRADQVINAHRFLSKREGLPTTREALAKALSIRPWNAKIKVLCFKVGDQFIRQQNRQGGEFYGGIFLRRKQYEIERNERGDHAEEAARCLPTVGKATEAHKAYAAGRLPDGRINARARRYVTKIFLSHLHHVSYLSYHGEPPPKPYALTHLDHAHEVLPPDFDATDGRSLRELFGEE